MQTSIFKSTWYFDEDILIQVCVWLFKIWIPVFWLAESDTKEVTRAQARNITVNLELGETDDTHRKHWLIP